MEPSQQQQNEQVQGQKKTKLHKEQMHQQPESQSQEEQTAHNTEKQKKAQYLWLSSMKGIAASHMTPEQKTLLYTALREHIDAQIKDAKFLDDSHLDKDKPFIPICKKEWEIERRNWELPEDDISKGIRLPSKVDEDGIRAFFEKRKKL